MIELAAIAEAEGPARPHRLHTLYISPLKALTTDVARNLSTPVREMNLPLRIESRTGDTPPHKRQRQRAHPPDMLLTTPEQLSLLIASEHARVFFEDLRVVVIDEIHALAPTKRGDLLALALARLQRWAPAHRRVGLSATVADEGALGRWLMGVRTLHPPPHAGEVPSGARGRGALATPPSVSRARRSTAPPQAGEHHRRASSAPRRALRRSSTCSIPTRRSLGPGTPRGMRCRKCTKRSKRPSSRSCSSTRARRRR
ncbi:MAG: DEAD/DEAH box helicase [Terricaulis sp.]|nr:DEAD/DEAH box helicase [Terricaulis sp.]